MKLCRACSGKGVKGIDVCDVCNGEGIDESSIVRTHKRKLSDTEIERKGKKNKFDKKNASREVF